MNNHINKSVPVYEESSPPRTTISGLNNTAMRLMHHGGITQQQRMIQDKRRSFDKATLYSYQGALVRKYVQNQEEQDNLSYHRALINPDKLKQDYDNKILSVGFESGITAGDIIEWKNPNSYWLVYLQDLTELAYFRAAIRRCSYMIEWEDENKDSHKTFAAVRGPVETRIDYIQKHGISVDRPNHSIHLLLPLNQETSSYFTRYAKFYLKDNPICWRVEGFDGISTPGILEIEAVEYYANEIEDDVPNGIVGGLIEKPQDPNPENDPIKGETFIKPKLSYKYTCTRSRITDAWKINDASLPVKLQADGGTVTLTWLKNYSGTFELQYGEFSKTIIVESLT